MIRRFEQITEQEFNQLKDSIALITILIAGADGTIDHQELEWAEKVTKIRTYASTDSLNGFYKAVGSDFEKSLETFISEFPNDTDQRTQTISAKLSKLNSILGKLDQDVAYELYDSFLTFAEHVAKASGGFMRFFSISKEEKALMSLPMLTPIEAPVEEEDDEKSEKN